MSAAFTRNGASVPHKAWTCEPCLRPDPLPSPDEKRTIQTAAKHVGTSPRCKWDHPLSFTNRGACQINLRSARVSWHLRACPESWLRVNSPAYRQVRTFLYAYGVCHVPFPAIPHL
ncbi:hypothetical protein M3J09_007884 [Ascochyta lentis]